MAIPKAACAAAILLLSLATGVRAQEITLESKDLYSTRTLKGKSGPLGGDQVVVKATSTLRGVLSLQVLDTNVAFVSYQKKAHTAKRDKATDYIDLVGVDLTRTASGLRLELRAPNPAPWEEPDYASVQVELVVPVGSRVRIEAVYFDVEAVGPFAELVSTESLGRCEVARVSERLEVATANRRLTAEDVSGVVSLQTSNSTLTARNLHDLSGAATFRNEGGGIRIESCRGDLSVRSEYGRVEIRDFHSGFERSHIRSLLGPVVVQIAEFGGGQLVVSNRHEDIELTVPEGLSSELTLAVEEGGRIDISDFLFVTDLVQPNRLGLRSGDGEGLISCSIRGKGNIYLWGSYEGD